MKKNLFNIMLVGVLLGVFLASCGTATEDAPNEISVVQPETQNNEILRVVEEKTDSQAIVEPIIAVEDTFWGIDITPSGESVSKLWFDTQTNTQIYSPVVANVETSITENGQYLKKVTYSFSAEQPLVGDYWVSILDYDTGKDIESADGVSAWVSEATYIDGVTSYTVSYQSLNEIDSVFVWCQDTSKLSDYQFDYTPILNINGDITIGDIADYIVENDSYILTIRN